ncbi:hypothetical protein BV25DRAFT_831288, partial [Artomyces pyxidatus]
MPHQALRIFSTPRPCTFYLKGQCTRGDACTFDHPIPSISSIASQGSPVRKATPRCKFFLRGQCSNRACPFVHADPVPSRTFDTPSVSHNVPPTACPYHLKGRCVYGEQCRFYHVPQMHKASCAGDLQVENHPRALPHETTSEPAEDVEQTITRTIHSCKVTLGPGLVVQHIHTDLESSRLILINLPEDILEAELEEMLFVFGTVRTHIFSSSLRPMALADFDDPKAAESAMTTLDRSTYRGRTLSARLEPRAPESEAGILRDTTVKVTWFAPSCVAYAHYSNISRAKDADQRTDGKNFSGRKIATTVQRPSYRQTKSFTVVVSGLPRDVDARALTQFMRCDSVRLVKPRQDAESSLRKLKQTLDIDEGSLEAFDAIGGEPGDTKLKAVARYASVAFAKMAVERLHGERMPYLDGSPIWLSYLQAVKFTLPRRQYIALAPRFAALMQHGPAGTASSLRWSVFEHKADGSEAPIVTIRLSGDDTQALGQKKVKVEALLLGVIVRGVDGIAWDDYFLSEQGQSIISDLAESVHGYARCDVNRHQVAIYAPDDGVRASLHALVLAEVTRLRTRQHEVEVDPSTFRWLVRSGINHLRERYGAANISLNLVRRRLIARVDNRGQLAAIRTFLQHVDEPPMPVAHGGSAIDCPVCMC